MGAHFFLSTPGREALERFVRELDRIDASTQGALLGEVSNGEVFEASACLVMRLVFLFKAEEAGLLPRGLLALWDDLKRPEGLAPGSAYARLLGCFQRVAAHGGLFQAELYPLLEGRGRDGSWNDPRLMPLPVDDAVVRDLLHRLKSPRGEPGEHQELDYRALEIEQLGQMYESLLECEVKRAPGDQRVLLLVGTSRNPMPEMLEPGEPMDSVAWVAELARRTGRSRAAISRQLREAGPDFEEAPLAVPRALLRREGIVRRGGVYVGAGEERREQGAHYTPPQLTRLIVQEALETVLHECDRRDPETLLNLTLCDPSMGSGAFLVQAVRLLGDGLADAWEGLVGTAEGPRTAPGGALPDGHGDEVLIPPTREERVLLARRFVAERCVYGIDRSALAVELARLSLWLVTAARERPFSFLDHALVKGDSLFLQEALTLPEVFREGRGGFDLVVGNPPWGSKLSEVEKRGIDSAFSLVGDYESAYAFFERSCALVKPGGHLALVLPDTTLRNDSASRLRAHLVRRMELRRVLELTEGEVFEDASVRGCVIHAQRRAPTDAPVEWVHADAQVERISKDRLPVSGPWTRRSTRVGACVASGRLPHRPPLGEFFEVRQGYIPYRESTLRARFGPLEGARIRDQRAWHADSRLDESSVRELQGGDVRPLEVTWSGTWVRYGRWVSTYLDPRYFSGPRVLVREIVGKAPYFVIAAGTGAEYVHNPSLLVLKPRPGMERLVPLLSVYLNSHQAGEWLRTHGSKADKGLFPKVLVKDLRALPFVPLALCTEGTVEAARDLASRTGSEMDRKAIDGFVERLLAAVLGARVADGDQK